MTRTIRSNDDAPDWNASFRVACPTRRDKAAGRMSRRVTGKSNRAGKQIDRPGFVNAFNGA